MGSIPPACHTTASLLSLSHLLGKLWADRRMGLPVNIVDVLDQDESDLCE